MDFWLLYAVENQQKYLYNNNGIIYMIINLHLITEKVINTEKNDYLTKRLHNILVLAKPSQKNFLICFPHIRRVHLIKYSFGKMRQKSE